MNDMAFDDVAARALRLAETWDRERAAQPARRIGRKLTDGVREEDGDLAWYVARAATRQEKRAEASLINAGVACYVPRMARWGTGGHQRKRVEQSLLEGYMFVGLEAGQSFHGVEKLAGMHAVVRFGAEARPRPTCFGAIALMLASEMAGHFDRTIKVLAQAQFEPGEAVRVVDGAFAGFTAHFVRLAARERVRLMLNLFGRLSEIELSADDIRKIS